MCYLLSFRPNALSMMASMLWILLPWLSGGLISTLQYQQLTLILKCVCNILPRTFCFFREIGYRYWYTSQKESLRNTPVLMTCRFMGYNNYSLTSEWFAYSLAGRKYNGSNAGNPRARTEARKWVVYPWRRARVLTEIFVNSQQTLFFCLSNYKNLYLISSWTVLCSLLLPNLASIKLGFVRAFLGGGEASTLDSGSETWFGFGWRHVSPRSVSELGWRKPRESCWQDARGELERPGAAGAVARLRTSARLCAPEDAGAPGPGRTSIDLEPPFAFSHFEQIKQRKLPVECWSWLGNESLILFTRKGLFFAWVIAAETFFSSPLCNVWYLRENSWAEHSWITAELKWDAGEYGLDCMAEKVSFFPCPSWRNAASFPRLSLGTLGRSWERQKEGWQTVPTNGTEDGFLHLFRFPALLFLIFGEDWNNSADSGFGEVVDDHVKQQTLMGQAEERLAQSTAVLTGITGPA